MSQDPDFEYHVSDTAPPFAVTLMRDGAPLDLTNVVSVQAHIRTSGGSANVMSGVASVYNATAGQVLFHISTADLGSAGFSSPGMYLGQVFASWASGRVTSSDFVVQVKPSYRLL